MLSNKQIVHPGVQVGRAFTGKHQGYVHVSDGVYWEAMYIAGEDEKIIQAALTDPQFENTQTRLQHKSFKAKFMRFHKPFQPTEIRHGK